jgi:MFS family permease
LETLPIGEDILPTTSTWEKLRILRDRNFGLMWVGGSVSMLGDAFTMVALPWLVIQLTDSAFALGMMLAIESIPRAFFILIGGALTDRISPRLVMIATKLLYMILMALLAVLVLSATIELWMVFVLAFLFGMVGAFAFPAHSAILPQIVSKEELPFANSIIGGITQICFLVGPALAGLLIVWFGAEKGSSGIVEETQTNLHTLGIIFVIDALTFLFSSITLSLVRIDRKRDIRSDKDESLLRSIRSGVNHLFHDRGLFLFTVYVSVVMFLAYGPIFVGIPLLASQRLPEGAAAFGLLMSAHSGGALAGIILAGLLPHPHARYLGPLIFIMHIVAGPIVVLLGWISMTIQGLIILFSFGIAEGYMEILLITWIQRRIPQQMLGRMMSLLIFATMGLAPLSGALSGYLVEIASLNLLFALSGGMFTLVAFLCLLSPKMRAMGLPPDDQLAV